MLLDEIARRYADEMYTRKAEQILLEQQQKKAEVRQNHANRGMAVSGPMVAAVGKIDAETISSLAEARAETLLKAYERAGVPFDDAVVREIMAEVTQICETQKGHVSSALTQFAGQTFGFNALPGMVASVTGQVESAVNSTLAKIGRDLRIHRYEIVLDNRKTQKVYAASLGKRWDAFVSHASEDKNEFVGPLAEALVKSGLSIWYDETTLKVGDSLRRAIDHGLANSQFGIVVLSHSFFAKQWPQQELDGLVSREIEGVKVILPVWHKIGVEEIRRYSPMLAGRLAANASAGLDVVVRQLREAMGLG